jgi:hypothetical protein
MLDNYERLGVFYLGREYDIASGQVQPANVLYDSKDLTTHAVIVGMTGSGKTGLGISLLEEAAIDEIPALIIDPKGDMGNLLLSFPDLSPADFEPWVEAGEAGRKGMTKAEFAADRAALWKKGLADWNQSPERIGKFKSTCEVVVYTPGSDAGLQLTVLKSLQAPSAETLASQDALRERVSAATAGICSLLGIDADPIRSREHILISNILDQAWRAGRNLDLGGLIYEIQTPSFRKIGIMDIDQIFPPPERMQLAMSLNNVLASPGFAGWMQGEALDIQRLLYSKEGKPRLCVLSIAHLADRERMFFVTILLNEVIAWMRAQPGTSSLRAILYMDEVFGYLPPTANPPSKTPMLTLLKQARAFGLGLVLATQNPVDLDYKALSNAGTWFLGRLQTERDKLRVLDGLEGASAAAGAAFDRAKMEQILSALDTRVFLLNNVHEDQPVVFHTRWALSYLGGPMTREQIQRLMTPVKQSLGLTTTAAAASEMASQPAGAVAASPESARPLLADGIEQLFLPVNRETPRDARIEYRPAVVGLGKVHFSDSAANVEETRKICLVAGIEDEVSRDPWAEAGAHDAVQVPFSKSPVADADWAELPKELTKPASYSGWQRRLKDHLYQSERLALCYCETLDQTSRPGQSEADFRVALKQQAREARDLAVEKLRQKYAAKIAKQREVIQSAEHRVQAEEEQAQGASMSAWVTTGTSILGALFGRKKITATNIGRAGSAARAHTRASQQKADIDRAEAKLEGETEELAELESALESEIEKLSEDYDVANLTVEAREVRPRKADVEATMIALLWRPYRLDGGDAAPAWEGSH